MAPSFVFVLLSILCIFHQHLILQLILDMLIVVLGSTFAVWAGFGAIGYELGHGAWVVVASAGVFSLCLIAKLDVAAKEGYYSQSSSHETL